MIEAAQFVDAARERGFDWYAGVPCSFLTPFINYVLQAPSLHYLSAANEGDAVALMAGATLAGRRGVTMMQNSGLGNAVSPLTSLTWTFRLPQLLIITWRGQPGVADEPQHALMGPITPAMLQTMEIAWEAFPTDADGVGATLDRAIAHMDATGRPYALVMHKGSVAPYPLRDATARARRAAVPIESMLRGVTCDGLPSRSDVLRGVIDATPVQGSVVLASTGFCGRQLYALHDRPNQLYMVGSMGCVMTMALGLALARPDLRVVALDGDGAALMRMGGFATLGAYGASNLVHIVLDNGVHDSTGGQASVSPGISFAGVAAACGYGLVVDGDDLGVLRRVFNAEPLGDGPRFACVKIRPGTPENLPRPCVTPEQVKARLMNHIAHCAGGR